MNRSTLIAAVIIIAAASGAWFMTRPAAPPATTPHDEAHERPHAEIAPARAAAAGIEMATAGPATIHQSTALLGRLSLDPAHTAQVRARFPGVVKEIRKSQGDTVAAGDILAMVESNDSLQTYAVRAPLAGTLLSRTVSPGEVTDTAPLFEIGNLRHLRADLHVFPNDLPKIAAGQPVRLLVQGEPEAVIASITTLVPVVESATQAVIARADVDNSAGRLRPGAMVRGEVETTTREAAVAVSAEALQQLDGRTVVFVRAGDALEAHDVVVGASDHQSVEILSGLTPGASYAARGSFVVKAEIEKGSAGHGH